MAACPLVDLRTLKPEKPKLSDEYLLAKSPTTTDFLLIRAHTEKEVLKCNLLGVFGSLQTFDKGWSGETAKRSLLKATCFEIVSIHGIPNRLQVLDNTVKNQINNVNQENMARPDPNHAQKIPLEAIRKIPEVPNQSQKIPLDGTKKKSEDPSDVLLPLNSLVTEVGPGIGQTGNKPKPDPPEPVVRKDLLQPPAVLQAQPQNFGQLQPPKVLAQVDTTPLPEETQVFMLTEDGALRTAKIHGTKLERMDLISAGTTSEWCNLGESLRSPWNPKRLKLIPEIGMLSYLETPTRILLIDIFRRHQYLKDVSVLMLSRDSESYVPKLGISSCILKSEHLALRIELTQAPDDYWSDVFLDITVQRPREGYTEPSIGLLTNSGLLYRFKLESKLKCGDPCDIYQGLKSWRKPFLKFAIHRTLTIDGRIFVIGILLFLNQVS